MFPNARPIGSCEITFDSFAASFESKLAKLSYRAPALVGAMLDDTGLRAIAEPRRSRHGLRHRSVRSADSCRYARRLTGIDLSGGMLTHAQEKQVYDELLQIELTEYLRGQSDAFDVIVSADTLVYFGALEQRHRRGGRRAPARRLLIFTLEHGAAPRRPTIISRRTADIRTRGRTSSGCSQQTGLIAEIGQAELRMESGVPVAGLVVRAQEGGPR